MAELPGDRHPLDRASGLPAALRHEASRQLARAVTDELAAVSDRGWRWIIPGDEGYPPLLQETADPPLGLFVRGELADAPVVAIVGALRATGEDVGGLGLADLGEHGVLEA